MIWFRRKPEPAPKPGRPNGVYITVEVLTDDIYWRMECPDGAKQRVYDFIMAENRRDFKEQLKATSEAAFDNYTAMEIRFGEASDFAPYVEASKRPSLTGDG